jgi:hypothetical protein
MHQMSIKQAGDFNAFGGPHLAIHQIIADWEYFTIARQGYSKQVLIPEYQEWTRT